MADWFTQNAPQDRSGSGDWFAANSPEAASAKPAETLEPAGAVSRFGTGIWDATIGGILRTVADIANRGGVAVANDALQQSVDFGKAAINEPDPERRAGLVAGAVPIAGPIGVAIARKMRDPQTGEFGKGDVAGGLGELAGIAVTGGAPRAATGTARATTRAVNRVPRVSAEPPPATAPMVKYAESKGIPLTLGEKTGSKRLQTVEKAMEMVPGGSGRAQEFYQGRNAKLRTVQREITDKAGPAVTDKTGAGEAVSVQMQERIGGLKKFANKQYESIRSQVDRSADQAFESARATYKGQKAAYESKRARIKAAGGDASSIEAPKAPKRSEIVGAPVEMTPIRERLKPLYDELSKSMPETQRQASPGYAALKSIVEDTKDIRDALDLDKDLGALKSIVRRSGKDYLSDASGRYASASISEIEKSVKQSLDNAGAGMPEQLRKARKSVQEYHATAEALASVIPEGESPVTAYRRLVAPGDANLNDLRAIKQRAPKSVKSIGRAFLDGLVEKAQQDGGWSRGDGVVAEWRKMGPRTKHELFGPQLTSEITDFLTTARQLTRDVNPSGSGKFIEAAKHIGGPAGVVIAGIASGHPVAAGAELVTANVVSRVLFTPGGAKLLTEPLKLPPSSPRFGKAVQRLNLAIERAKKDEGAQE